MVEWKKLGDICNILDSQRKPVSKGDRKEGKYPYYGANGIQDYVDNFIFDGTYLLMGEDGSVINTDKSPVIHWATGKIWVNNHAHVLEENDSTYLRYIYYSLQCTDVSDLVRGVPPKINQANMRGILIPVPSKNEQNRIVGILDTFTASIDNLKEQIVQRRKQYEYYRDQLLDLEGKEGVEIKSLGVLCELVTKQTGFDYSSRIKPALLTKKEDNSIPFLQTKNFSGRYFDYNTDYHVPNHIVQQFPKIVLDKPCLLFSIVGASIGNVGLFPGDIKCFLGGAISVLKFKNIVNIHYVYEIMSSWYGQKLIKSKIKGGGQNTITVEDIRRFTIPVPSISEQQRIVSILDTFEASIQNLEAQLSQREKQYEYYRNKLLTFE